MASVRLQIKRQKEPTFDSTGSLQAMSDSTSTFLHIQARGSSASRVLELTTASVRVGGGSHCEVRLPGLASTELLCVVRRRGEDWQVQPIGPPGQVAIDGIPIERPRPWPVGVPLRVGDHLLCLHRPADEPNRPGSFQDPIAIVPESIETEPAAASAEIEEKPDEPTERTESTDSASTHSEKERLARWQASLERRERWLKARREERKWEHRWRVAGERLRARSTRTSVDGLREATGAAEGDPLRTRPSAGATENPAAAGPAPKPEPMPQTQAQARTEPASPQISEPATLRPEASRSEPDREVEPFEPKNVPKLGAVTPLDVESLDTEPEQQEHEPTRLIDSDSIESTLAELTSLLDPDELAGRLAWESSGTEAPVVEPMTADPVSKPEPEARSAPNDLPEPPETDPAPPLPPPPPLSLPAPEPKPEPEPIRGTEAKTEPEAEAEAATETEPELDSDDSGRSSPLVGDRLVEEPAWPSAKAILEAHRTSASATTSQKARPGARTKRRPMPTEVRAPEHWSLPAFWTVPPAIALVILFGGLGLALAWTWSQDGRVAATLADRLLSGQSVPAGGLASEPLPSPTWWGTTANHLYWQAAAIGRLDGDPSRMEEARYLLGLAANASPLHPGVRSIEESGLLELGGRDPEGRPAPRFLSRDIHSLSLSARRAQEEGRLEDAQDAYQQAITLVASADPALAAPPRIAEGRGNRRALLPNEDLALPILRGLAETSGGDDGAWSSALPDAPLVLLSAYRVLREQGSAQAEPVLERLLNLPQPVGQALRETIDLAARAEAEAFREDWPEAEQTYLRVIDQTSEVSLRRLWWQNLAAVYARLDDLDRMEAARANAETGATRLEGPALFLGRSEAVFSLEASLSASE